MSEVGRDRGGVKGIGLCPLRLSSGCPQAVHAPQTLLRNRKKGRWEVRQWEPNPRRGVQLQEEGDF